MNRMEAIRNQQLGSSSNGEGSGNYPRRPCACPRFAFWRWFWFLLLLSLLGGFFGFKGQLIDWLHEKGLIKSSPVATAPAETAAQ